MSPDNAADAELRRVLRERAHAMAAPPPAEASTDFVDLVVFRLGDERYAIEAEAAREAIVISAVTILPGAPVCYRGLISHHGAVYPLLDIRSLLNAAPGDDAPPAEAVLIESDEYTVAICADSVESLAHIERGSIAEVRSAADGSGVSSVRGVTGDSIVVLDVHILLADARLIIDDRTPISDQSLKGMT